MATNTKKRRPIQGRGESIAGQRQAIADADRRRAQAKQASTTTTVEQPGQTAAADATSQTPGGVTAQAIQNAGLVAADPKQRVASVIPSWALSFLPESFTADDLKTVMANYNAMHPDTPVTNEVELGQRLKEHTEQNQLVLSAAFVHQGGNYVKVDLGPAFGGQVLDVPVQHAAAAAQNLAAVAPQFHLVGGVAKRTEVPWQLLMAAAQAQDTFGPSKLITKQEQAGRREYIGRTTGVTTPRPTGFRADLMSLGRTLKQNLDAFEGDVSMALIATRDMALAGKLYNGVPLTSDEQLKVQQLFIDAGWSKDSLAQMGLAVDGAKLDYINDRAGAVAHKITVTVPDPAKIRQSVDTLFRSWFQQAPGKGELESFERQLRDTIVNRQVSDANVAQASYNPLRGKHGSAAVTTTTHDVDPTAQLIELARRQPDYATLFANRGNLSEDEYAGLHRGAATSVLGDQGVQASDAIRAGMAAGNTQTTIGAASGSGMIRDSSEFHRRLAEAADAVARMT